MVDRRVRKSIHGPGARRPSRWFNSIGIGLGTLTSVIAIGGFLINETRAEVPLFRFELFKKRNFAYAIICLFTFLLVNLSSSDTAHQFS